MKQAKYYIVVSGFNHEEEPKRIDDLKVAIMYAQAVGGRVVPVYA